MLAPPSPHMSECLCTGHSNCAESSCLKYLHGPLPYLLRSLFRCHFLKCHPFLIILLKIAISWYHLTTPNPLEKRKWSLSVVLDSLRTHGLYSLPGSSIHGIFQAGILEWVSISFSRRSSQSRDWTLVSHIVGRRFTIWATREVNPLTLKIKSYLDLIFFIEPITKLKIYANCDIVNIYFIFVPGFRPDLLKPL